MAQYSPNGFDLVTSSPVVLKEYLKKNFRKDWKILFVPKTGSVMKNWRLVGTLAYAAGNLLLCIDELGLLCENGQFRHDAKNADPIIEQIIHYGRHRNIAVTATCQRPTDIALRFRALCTEFRIFKTTEPADLKYIEERVGRSTTEKLPGLDKFWFVLWKDDGETIIVKPQKVSK